MSFTLKRPKAKLIFSDKLFVVEIMSGIRSEIVLTGYKGKAGKRYKIYLGHQFIPISFGVINQSSQCLLIIKEESHVFFVSCEISSQVLQYSS